MSDARTSFEKTLWALIGPPLYYCATCLKAVQVKAVTGGEPVVKWDCECKGQIIAPRKAIVAGEGGLNFTDNMKEKTSQLFSALTGRCV